LGITQRHGSKVCQTYLKEGDASIKICIRGRRKGEKHALTAEQEKGLRKFLTDKTPDQLKLPFALWTRESIRLLIKQQYSPKPSRRMLKSTGAMKLEFKTMLTWLKGSLPKVTRQ
jgi:hypothetical protein